VFHKTIIAVTAAVALGCVPVATSALAADHPGGGHSGGHAVSGHAMSGHAMGGHAKGGYARSGHVPDTEVATTAAVDRSMTVAIAIMVTAAPVSAFRLSAV
jgi:hypothetical protein